ncbi:hypothetical protein SDJN03_15976, partial [Cucurbita argyrosperma subsp. sororia]
MVTTAGVKWERLKIHKSKWSKNHCLRNNRVTDIDNLAATLGTLDAMGSTSAVLVTTLRLCPMRQAHSCYTHLGHHVVPESHDYHKQYVSDSRTAWN